MSCRLLVKILICTSVCYTSAAFAARPYCSHRHTKPPPLNKFMSVKMAKDASASEEYAAKLYVRLTGAPPNFFDPRYRRVVDMVAANKFLEAAQMIMTDPGFLK